MYGIVTKIDPEVICGLVSHARAKVSWSTIVKLLDQEGIGNVDRLQQSKAVLANLVVSGLLPGLESWKQWLYELQEFFPKLVEIGSPNSVEFYGRQKVGYYYKMGRQIFSISS